MQNGFEYSSAPRSVAANRSKYKDPASNDEPKRQNIMYDRRIIRGNTHAVQVVPQPLLSSMEGTRKRPKAPNSQQEENVEPPRTPPPVGGRINIDIQTETYLEELTDRVPESNVETQTDPYLDGPAKPLFIPTKSGVDATTQIEDGDLFCFDLEVEPILEVLVGKTLEVSMMEVMEEEEFDQIKKHQDIYTQAKNVELVELQRLEGESNRKLAEKKRRLNEEEQRVLEQQELEEKVAARSIAKQYLSDLHTVVLGQLVESGHFCDPVQKEVTQQFIPFLVSRVCKEVENLAVAETLTDSLIAQLCATRCPNMALRLAA